MRVIQQQGAIFVGTHSFQMLLLLLHNQLCVIGIS